MSVLLVPHLSRLVAWEREQAVANKQTGGQTTKIYILMDMNIYIHLLNANAKTFYFSWP